MTLKNHWNFYLEVPSFKTDHFVYLFSIFGHFEIIFVPFNKLYMNFFDLQHYTVIISGIEIAYLDEGDPSGQSLLLLHGVPTWSFTFRNMITDLTGAGYRLIIPDLPGFGRSEKPTDSKFYTFKNVTNILHEFIQTIQIKNMVIYGQDWGALFAMALGAYNEKNVTGLILCNGYIPLGTEKQPITFILWKFIVKYFSFLPVSLIIRVASNTHLTSAEMEGYDFPFKYSGGKTAMIAYPWLLPFRKDSQDEQFSKDIWKIMKAWKKPLMTIFGTGDAISRGGDKIIHALVPGAKLQQHKRIKGGHFLTQDNTEELIRSIIEFKRINT
jgi:haloalkane dehalogenase